MSTVMTVVIRQKSRNNNNNSVNGPLSTTNRRVQKNNITYAPPIAGFVVYDTISLISSTYIHPLCLLAESYRFFHQPLSRFSFSSASSLTPSTSYIVDACHLIFSLPFPKHVQTTPKICLYKTGRSGPMKRNSRPPRRLVSSCRGCRGAPTRPTYVSSYLGADIQLF